MYFRFGAALALVVLISLGGTALEKRSLELRREISRQHYQLEELSDRHAAHRMEAHQLGAPERLIEQLDRKPPATAPAFKPARAAKPPKAR